MIFLIFFSCYCYGQDTIAFKDLKFQHQAEDAEHPQGYFYYKGNAFTGVAIERYANHSVKRIARYQHGSLEGPYQEWYENGASKLEEERHLGKRNGVRALWYSNGQKQSLIKYYMDLPYDTSLAWYENGQLKSVQYQSMGDTIVQWYRTFFENGQMRAHVGLDKGYFYHPNGRMKTCGKIVQHQRHGVWRVYDEKGKLIRKEKWVMGKMIQP